MPEVERETESNSLDDDIIDINELFCGDFVNAVPVLYLKYMGYNLHKLYCDVCECKINKPHIFNHYGIDCIKGSYIFENRDKGIFFLHCLKSKKKHCKMTVIRKLSTNGFLKKVEEYYKTLRKKTS